MDTRFEVLSYHLNIGEGDSAVYSVTKDGDPAHTVLIDGGRRAAGDDTLHQFMESPEARNHRIAKFDTIVITHWDDDHASGVLAFFLKDLKLQLSLYRERNKAKLDPLSKTQLKATLQEAANKGDIRSSFLQYDEATPICLPLSMIYVPYRLNTQSNVIRQLRLIDRSRAPHGDVRNYDWFTLDNENKGQRLRYGKFKLSIFPGDAVEETRYYIWVRAFVVGPTGQDLLGLDLFTGKKVIRNIEEADSPEAVSKFMARYSTIWKRPVLYCIGCDGFTLCPDERRYPDEGDRYDWTDTKSPPSSNLGTMDLTNLVLRRGAGQRSASTKCVDGPTTGNNLSSIACMIIWPNKDEAVVSHYVGGDVGDENEELFLRWATVQDPQSAMVRRPINVGAMKLSHHGSKFSTPALMLFAWKPAKIVVSNSRNFKWNHPSWEIVLLIWVYVRVRRKSKQPGNMNNDDGVLLATTYPPYLCSFLDLWSNRIVSMKVGSIDSLELRSGADFRAIVDNVWRKGLFRNWLDKIRDMANDAAKAEALAKRISDCWKEFSLIYRADYMGRPQYDTSSMAANTPQKICAVRLLHKDHNPVEYHIFISDNMKDIEQIAPNSLTQKTVSQVPSAPTALQTMKPRPLPKSLGGDETTGNTVHENRSRRIPLPDKIIGRRTFDIFLKDTMESMEEDKRGNSWCPTPSPSLRQRLPSTSLPPGTEVRLNQDQFEAPGPEGRYFIKASDSDATPSVGPLTYRPRDGHLDWFLGDLNTGTLVLADKPHTEPHSYDQVPMMRVHNTDETSEWFIHCLGSTDDGECAVSARVITIPTEGPQQLVNITGFELQTRFKYLWRTPDEAPDSADTSFFQDLVIFSAEHNFHDFGITGNTWPNIAASGDTSETDTLVGPAHIVCLSLGKTPSIAGKHVKLSYVLSMFQIQASGWLDSLIKLADFELTVDTARGQKNALWYTPAEHHETTLRLCFKQATAGSGDQSIFKKVCKLLHELTGFDSTLAQGTTVEPRIIVKKSWTLIGETQVETAHEVTVLLQMALPRGTSSIGEPFQFDTALIFGSDGATKWVINFEQGESFEDLIKLIVNLFSASDLEKNLNDYLPGCDQVFIRRVVFTNAPASNSKSLEVVLQVFFADMIFQCSLEVDFITAADGKTTTTKFGFFGKLFPESRTAKLGEHFFWVPYTSGYERWTTLEIAPVKNAVGVLEDAPATEVGDLRKAFNALRKKDAPGQPGQKELVATPTGLELVGLQFGLTGEEVTFSATVISDFPKDQKIPAIKLLAATLDLRYDVNKKAVSNCSLLTSMMMTAPDKSIPPAKWNLELAYDADGEAALWTLSGGVGGLRGDLLYSLFDEDSNSEMSQLLANITLSLQLTYKYNSQAKASDFLVEGNLWLGHLRFRAKYCYPSNGEWTFEASLNPEEDKDHDGDEPQGQNLLGVLESICGPGLMSVLPEMVRDIPVTPTEKRDLTSLRIVRLERAILMLVRLQITDKTSMAFYQYQPRRTGKEEKAPKAKRALVFALDQLPKVPEIPLVGTMPQPFDEARFLWVGGGDAQGWTRKEIEELNKNAQGYPQIIFRDTGKKPQGGDHAAYDEKAKNNVVLKSGFHLCLVEGGETRLDYAFGGNPEKDPKEKGFDASSDDDETEIVTPMANIAKVNKTMGPVTILGVGLDFDINEKKLKLIIDGTVKLGPIDLTLLGFSLTFDLKDKTLTNLSMIDVAKDITVGLDGLAVGFQKDPISIAGMFEHRKTGSDDLYLGGAVVGFKEWKLEAGGYYGTAGEPKEPEPKLPQGLQVMGEKDFKAFLAYVRVSGPIATIGYAEIRGLVGGFGYNTSIKMPTIDTVQSFPFLAQSPTSSAAGALTDMIKGGWFSPKEGDNWVAAGLTVQAFEMLKVTAVVTVEWGSSVRLGIFGLATAEIPKGRPEQKKFAVVQLGVVAMVDFNAGVMKVDGQLTPASYILDESCHLTGGFGLYTWFGPGTQQGDWVFTIGGYHPSYHKPGPYPKPGILGISWSYDSHINITGGAYFAVTPKTCMGGGSLHVALTLGPLYAYLDVHADFLINYRPFLYRASAGVMVGVNYTLDLWLVTIPIKVDLSAIIWLQGPPLSGTVHVDFFVFGFDVKFGPQNMPGNDKISLWDFYHLVIQATEKGAAQAIGEGAGIQPTDQDVAPTGIIVPSSQLVNCISGLVPESSADKNQGPPAAGEKWRVRGAVFAFTVSCKFAIQTATVFTQSIHQDGTITKEHKDITNTAKGEVSARPMHLPGPFAQSYLQISITAPAPPPHPSGIAELQTSNPIWKDHELGYSNLPTALYGRYDSKTDPSDPQSDPSAVLNSSDATTNLLTSITLHAPGSIKPENDIAAFDVASAMGQKANDGQPPTDFPVLEGPHGKWMPAEDRDPDMDRQMKKVKNAWGESAKVEERGISRVTRATEFMAGLGLGGWEWEEASRKEVKVPEKMVEEMGVWWIEAPGLCELEV